MKGAGKTGVQIFAKAYKGQDFLRAGLLRVQGLGFKGFTWGPTTNKKLHWKQIQHNMKQTAHVNVTVK